MSLQGRIIKIRTEDLQQDRGSFNQEAFDGSRSLYNFCIFLTGNPVGKRAGHIAAQSSGSTPTPFPSMTSCSLLYVPPCRWDSLGHNLDSSHLHNAVVICQPPPPTPYLSLLPACAGGAKWGWCWGVIGPCHGLCIWAHARRHAHSLCGWWRWMPCAFEHSERVSVCDRQSISLWWEVIAQWTDQLVIFSGGKQKKNTTVLQVSDLHFTPLSSLSSFLYIYLSVFSRLPHSSLLCASFSTSPLWIWLFGCLSLLISPPAPLIGREVEIQLIKAE